MLDYPEKAVMTGFQKKNKKNKNRSSSRVKSTIKSTIKLDS
jgi:hypothetical protein